MQRDHTDIVSVPITELTVEMGLEWDFLLKQWWLGTSFPTVFSFMLFLCSDFASI